MQKRTTPTVFPSQDTIYYKDIIIDNDPQSQYQNSFHNKYYKINNNNNNNFYKKNYNNYNYYDDEYNNYYDNDKNEYDYDENNEKEKHYYSVKSGINGNNTTTSINAYNNYSNEYHKGSSNLKLNYYEKSNNKNYQNLNKNKINFVKVKEVTTDIPTSNIGEFKENNTSTTINVINTTSTDINLTIVKTNTNNSTETLQIGKNALDVNDSLEVQKNEEKILNSLIKTEILKSNCDHIKNDFVGLKDNQAKEVDEKMLQDNAKVVNFADKDKTKYKFNRKELFKKRQKCRFNFIQLLNDTEVQKDEIVDIPDSLSEYISDKISKFSIYKYFNYNYKEDTCKDETMNNNIANSPWDKIIKIN